VIICDDDLDERTKLHRRQDATASSAASCQFNNCRGASTQTGELSTARGVCFNRMYFRLTQIKSGQSRGLEGVLKATTGDSWNAGVFYYNVACDRL
jgi:hypothetical protein